MNLDMHALNAEAGRRLAIQHCGPMKHQDLPSITAKERARLDLERQTQEFLRAGGKIKQADAEIPTFDWPLSRDSRQLVSIANFAHKYSIRETEILAAARRRELTVWTFQGDRHLLRTKAMAWHKKRQIEPGFSTTR